MKITTVVFDADGLIFPGDTKEALAKYMLETGEKSKLSLYWHGIPTYYALNRVKQLDAKGKDEKADKWAKAAYRHYDGIIRGLKPDYIGSFGRKCGEDIAISTVTSIMNLSEKYDLFLISGGIQDLTEAALEKASIHKYFRHICCNRLELEDGRVVGLDKATSTPEKKAQIVRRIVDLERTAAIGHDYWDRDIFRAVALPICHVGGSWAPNSARRIAEKRGRLVESFEQAEDVLDKA